MNVENKNQIGICFGPGFLHASEWYLDIEKNHFGFLALKLDFIITNVACAGWRNWFFFPKPDFLEFIWIFSDKNHLKINISHILNPNVTK